MGHAAAARSPKLADLGLGEGLAVQLGDGLGSLGRGDLEQARDRDLVDRSVETLEGTDFEAEPEPARA
jgi:hypothetical protein